MANPLFNALNKTQANNDVLQFIKEARKFREKFSGNPRDEVQKMMNEGKLSQAQFNSYAQMATEIMSIMN